MDNSSIAPIITHPADFYNHLMEITNGKIMSKGLFTVYEGDDGNKQFEIKRQILSMGLELAIVRYTIKETTTFPFWLDYDGIEMSAFLNDNYETPAKTGFQLRFSEKSVDARRQNMMLLKGCHEGVNVYADKIWLQEHVDVRWLQFLRNFPGQGLDGNRRETFLAIAKQIVNSPLSGDAQRIFNLAKSMELFSVVLSQIDEHNKKYISQIDQLPLEDAKALYLAKEIIEERYAEGLTIDYIAKQTFVSPNKLMRNYKKFYGMTIYKHIQSCRMKSAYQLIATQKMPVHLVANTVGYNHVGHFIKLFKKHYGFTPGDVQWRLINQD